MTTRVLEATEVSPDNFKEFGQVIEALPDGQAFGPADAKLVLRGVPRFYIMQLHDRELEFSCLTHHVRVTQCLGSISGEEWYLGVAKPSILGGNQQVNHIKSKVVQSKCGHFYVAPEADDVRVFRIVGPKFVMLNIGTWHAGPFFKVKSMNFYNLELSNTNVEDHTTYNLNSNIFRIHG